jgi:predicted transcriptional regulator/uncharacterized protein (DUF433 family)
MAESIVRDGTTGRAIVSSTGTPVDDILDAIESSGTVEGALGLHPGLTVAAVAAALQFARIAVRRGVRYAPEANFGVSELRERPVQPFGTRSSSGATVVDEHGEEGDPSDHRAVFGTVEEALKSATAQRERLLYELDLIESIQAGLEDAVAGRVIPHEEVMARIKSRFPG